MDLDALLPEEKPSGALLWMFRKIHVVIFIDSSTLLMK